ncbi:MAG: ribosome maturation factor RimM [Alphaproteobacteria bacterium]|nr:ribosome maturation factor RimM [Alphaproteobacteria bacterium]
MSSGDTRVCLGVIVGARGLKGDVRIKSFTADPQDVAAYGPLMIDDGSTMTLKITGEAKGVVIGRIKGVEDRTKVEALKGQNLYVERGALPETGDEEEFYHADLVGIRVEDETGQECGTVSAIYDFVAGDMVDLRLPNGRTVLVPFTSAAVPTVDIAGGRMVVMASALAAAEDEPVQDNTP